VTQIIKKSLVELFGTATLVCVVVGSGIMGVNLSSNLGVALLINAISTIFALALLIHSLGPISRAHFNPAVTLVQFLGKNQQIAESAAYIVSQIIGAILGAILANLMFDLSAIQISDQTRVSSGTLLGEVIATAGLIVVIGIFVYRNQINLISIAVAAWIGSAYFFTSSTSFANPAVTIGRIFSDTFTGIAPSSVLPYIGAQLVGALLGMTAIKFIKNLEIKN
jgi:glycerol uptake facilitator-like aquaporin